MHKLHQLLTDLKTELDTLTPESFRDLRWAASVALEVIDGTDDAPIFDFDSEDTPPTEDTPPAEDTQPAEDTPPTEDTQPTEGVDEIPPAV